MSSFDPWTPDEKSACLGYGKAKQSSPKSEGRTVAIKSRLSGKRGNVQFYWEFPGPGHHTLLHKTQMNAKKLVSCTQQCPKS